jgi:hypothetical protein
MRIIFLFAVFISVIFFSSCSLLQLYEKKDISGPQGKEAVDILNRLKMLNTGLKTYKGIGKLKLWNKEKIFAARTAWIAALPEKIRIQIMGLPGQSVAMLASNGKYIYFQTGEDQLHKIRTDKASLERVIYIPIKATDIIKLLAGQVPLTDYSSIRIEPSENADGYVLTMKRMFWEDYEKVFVDRTKEKIQHIDMYDSTGELIYRAVFENMQYVDGYHVPSQIAVHNDKGIGFRIRIDRYWAGVDVSPSAFEFKNSEKKKNHFHILDRNTPVNEEK